MYPPPRARGTRCQRPSPRPNSPVLGVAWTTEGSDHPHGSDPSCISGASWHPPRFTPFARHLPLKTPPGQSGEGNEGPRQNQTWQTETIRGRRLPAQSLPSQRAPRKPLTSPPPGAPCEKEAAFHVENKHSPLCARPRPLPLPPPPPPPFPAGAHWTLLILMMMCGRSDRCGTRDSEGPASPPPSLNDLKPSANLRGIGCARQLLELG